MRVVYPLTLRTTSRFAYLCWHVFKGVVCGVMIALGAGGPAIHKLVRQSTTSHQELSSDSRIVRVCRVV